MERSQIREGVLKMRYEEVYGKYQERILTTFEAADLLGISPRTFLRYRDRSEEEDFDGRFDRRIGKRSGQRAQEKEVEMVTGLYRTKFRDFNVKHFHAFAKREHGLIRGYTWTKSVLEKAGLIKKSKRGGDHRLRRERKSMAGMMIHQDGSTHAWIPELGHNIDLIVTMDDATSIITSAFFCPQEGTLSTLQGIYETITHYGLFCTFYTDRGSHYWYTPEAGGKVSKTELTEVGRALQQLRIQHTAAYSPQARGRSERMFGTLQGRVPQEIALRGIKTMEEANRYLKEEYIPRHNQEFSIQPASAQSAYVPWAGEDLKEILCIQEVRRVQNDNTIMYRTLRLQIPKDESRHHYVRADVHVRAYMDGGLGVFCGHRCLGRYTALGVPLIKEVPMTSVA